MNVKSALLPLLFLLGLTFVFAMPYAQFGEQAGQPTLNVSLGGSATFNYSVLNFGSTPRNFTVVSPTLNTIPHNATPTVTVTPMSGFINPGAQQEISIKVSMPSSDKIGLKWQGIVQVVEVAPSSGSSGGMGATITAGVAKILTIYSIAPKASPLIYYIISIAIVIIVIAVVAYFVAIKRKARVKRKKERRAIRKVKKGAKGRKKRKVARRRKAPARARGRKVARRTRKTRR